MSTRRGGSGVFRITTLPSPRSSASPLRPPPAPSRTACTSWATFPARHGRPTTPPPSVRPTDRHPTVRACEAFRPGVGISRLIRGLSVQRIMTGEYFAGGLNRRRETLQNPCADTRDLMASTPPKYMDLADQTGRTVGLVTVLRRVPSQSVGSTRYRCRCECGVEIDVCGWQLAKGWACGCKLCRAKARAARKK